MSRISWPIAFLASFCLTSSGSAKDKKFVVYKPASQWVGQYELDHCAFSRRFENGGKSLTLEFRQFEPGLALDLFILATDERARGSKLEFNFAPNEHSFGSRTSYRIKGDDGSQGFYSSARYGHVLKSDQEPEGASAISGESILEWAESVEGIEITKGFRFPTRLETGPLDKMRIVMNHCLTDLLTEWGLDKEKHEKMSKRATLTNLADLSQKARRSYPRKALISGRHGPVRIRVIVDESGDPRDCIGLANETHESLLKSACRHIINTAKFEPALDSTGKPMRSYHVQHVNYLLSGS